MRRLILLAPLCCILFAGNPKALDLPLIDRLHKLVALRFLTPLPGRLGMSRIARPASMGEHFQPLLSADRDFVPENPAETEVLDSLEGEGLQVGLYVFGEAALKAAPQALDYRALKGPGIVTRGTPRPAWYPRAAIAGVPSDTLPDWNAIYPLAREAMQRFQNGGKEFETKLGGWNIAARAVARDQKCAMCHSGAPAGASIGGVLYAFRRPTR